uniref:Uncharacterized protein n=1 Tax=Ananas comosus var. bracteatus TaxID=296719 RepID=A0A6V7NG67_ANACO|nr:unnamed protein product [Ananas comosus var. bracteatus]
MAVSAFRSTSKRGSNASPSRSAFSPSKEPVLADSRERIPPRRSRSVSAAPRRCPDPSPTPPAVSEYSNTRNNPLFGCPSSSSSSSPESESRVGTANGGIEASSSSSRRGRPVSKEGSGNRRIRSVSRGHYGYSEQSGVEHGYRSSSSVRDKEIDQKANNGFSLSEPKRKLETWTSRHPVSDSSDASSSCTRGRHWEDGVSTSCSSEEATNRNNGHYFHDAESGEIYEIIRPEVPHAISEIRDDFENAIQRTNPATTAAKNIIDIPLELNHGEIELVSDIRREYATKLEQTQERARKLRADLAVEEQREQELSRILKDILPVQRSSETCRGRPKRKTSVERVKMSRRLAEEAMNYFEECVSISTFDSSDLSSLEDPQPCSVDGIQPMGNSRFFHSEGSTISASHFPGNQPNPHEDCDNQTQCSITVTDLDTPRSGKSRFSFSHQSDQDFEVHDIRNYIKKFEKDISKEHKENVKVRSSYNSDDYVSTNSAESLLSDIVILKNRIESGGLLLCNMRIF